MHPFPKGNEVPLIFHKERPMSKRAKNCDVIVIGAGAAGCVVAGRLAERSTASVVVLEAGLNDFDPLIHIPAGFAKILQKDWHVWAYDTAPQTQLDGTAKRYRSGRVVGGGSSINAMCYVRGQPKDFNEWQEAAGDKASWDFETMLRHFRAQECNDTFHDSFHGIDGPLRISLPRGINTLNAGCLRAFQEAGLPYNPDYNGASQRGVSPVQGNYADGRRCSAADAFLRPALRSGRVELRTSATVTRILIDQSRAIGVEYVSRGKRYRLYAGQVVLSSGAIHSPKMLMLSGVGAADRLRNLGVRVQHDSPETGQNLQDHPIVPLKAFCRDGYGYQRSAQGFGALKTGLRYLLTKTGPASTNAIDTVSYFDPRDLSADPSIQCYHAPIISEDGLSPAGKQAGVTFELVVLRPRSRGSITLDSIDPRAMPRINPNFFAEAEDLDLAVQSVRYMREVMGQPSLQRILTSEVAPGIERQSDAELAQWIRQVATTMWHPVGTCRMGADDRAVVDSRLRVNGIGNLRVIDASIMPNITSGNTNAPTMALARHGADMMIDDLHLA